MTWLRRWLFQGKFWVVLLEAWVLAAMMLFLVLSVVREIPTGNIPATFIFLTQVAVFWAVFRLKPAVRPQRWQRLLWEFSFALALRCVVAATAWAEGSLFHAWEFFDWQDFIMPVNLLLLTVTFFPFLLGRLMVYAFWAWKGLAERSFLWMMVNSHLLTVFILIVLVIVLTRIQQGVGDHSTAVYPEGVLANIILSLVRSIIPWVGVSVILAGLTIAAFFPPTLAVSYLSSRRFVRRIRELAAAMKQVRQGNLDVRVTPAGQDEIAQLQSDFNQMADDLQQEREKVSQLLKNQRELSAVVSHELRTPISVIRAYLENDLADSSAGVPANYRGDLQVLYHQTLSLQGLVEDLFTLSQMDQNRFDLECRSVDLLTVIHRVHRSLQKVAWDSKRIDLAVQTQPPLLPEIIIWADEKRLEQVFSNLVQNAIRHTPEGGVVVLGVRLLTGQAEVSVVDSGEGIAPLDLPHIWERFYRGAHGSTTGRTGIGLSLVKDLVEKMGGSVGVESQPGEGSRFWVTLRVLP